MKELIPTGIRRSQLMSCVLTWQTILSKVLRLKTVGRLLLSMILVVMGNYSTRNSWTWFYQPPTKASETTASTAEEFTSTHQDLFLLKSLTPPLEFSKKRSNWSSAKKSYNFNWPQTQIILAKTPSTRLAKVKLSFQHMDFRNIWKGMDFTHVKVIWRQSWEDVIIVETRNCNTVSSVRLSKFWFQDNLSKIRKQKKAMVLPIPKRLRLRLKLRTSLTPDHTGKLLRTNEELQKMPEENNGCKTKKTEDKDFSRKLKNVEPPRNLDASKTERTSKPESKLRDKEEKPNSKLKNKSVKSKG